MNASIWPASNEASVATDAIAGEWYRSRSTIVAAFNNFYFCLPGSDLFRGSFFKITLRFVVNAHRFQIHSDPACLGARLPLNLSEDVFHCSRRNDRSVAVKIAIVHYIQCGRVNAVHHLRSIARYVDGNSIFLRIGRCFRHGDVNI